MAHSLSTTQTRDWYNTLSGFYDRLAEPSERPARLQGLRLLRPRAGEAILEIGFGTGHALVALAHAVGPRGRAVGVDLSDRMRDVARDRVHSEHVEGWTSLHVADARALPFPDADFDAVFCSFTLELFSDDEIPTVLAEIRRVLKPGGRVGVVSLASSARPSFSTRCYQRLHRWFPKLVDCHPIDATAALRAAGFSVSNVELFSLWGIGGQSVIGLTSRT
jgi:demethylmenaquinone methyltransferase/2-methoxy-6-polyprenyl-1,4-benzoquinol methylase